ncbi:MAG: hypothetical protein PHC83_05890 [Bacteroidales bacterium]|nr:hypothetical protein [Bacteroidales bacterium]MDD4209453.1 hypothetical protein [Bacteroidales bacterium]
MDRIILNTGLWSAIICLTSFIVWIISFTGIAIQSPLFFWTNIEEYIHYVNDYNQFFQYLAKSFMIIFSLAYMILAVFFYEFTFAERKIFAKIGLIFSIMFALVSSVHYYVQISSVRFTIAEGEYSGLEHLIQSNPASALLSVNMLGWTLFLGLSCLFIFTGLIHNSGTKGIRLGLLINAFSYIFGGIGYLFQIDLLTFVFMNLGIGFGFIIMTISSIKLINALKRAHK